MTGRMGFPKKKITSVNFKVNLVTKPSKKICSFRYIFVLLLDVLLTPLIRHLICTDA